MKNLTTLCCLVLFQYSIAQPPFFKRFNTALTSRHLTGVTVMSSGDYLLGNTGSRNSDSSQAVCKLGDDGTFKWIKRYDIYGGIYAIMEVGNQELLFAEHRRDSITNKNCPAFFKTDTAGNVLWGKYFSCDTGNVNLSLIHI